MKEQRGDRLCTHQALMHKKEEAGGVNYRTIDYKADKDAKHTILAHWSFIQRVNDAE